ncbi:MAG TPA: benzoate-CoA ligase family protein [Bryobacteraceae bacterium]|nr:benzoate-CoA ligase family protein [Bryobacteraceae bacterium]
MAEPFNLASYFVDRHVAEGRGSRTAIICEGRRLTYAEIAAQVNQAGNALRRAGVQPGSRVLIILPDSPEFVAAYFGAMKIGAVAVPCNTALRPADYEFLLADSQARLVVSAAAPLDCARESPELESAPASGDDAAFWLWTSGSTGSPKAAIHRHGGWMACCEGYARGVLDIRPDDITFSSSKLFHAYGLGNGLMFPFYVGATTVLYPGKPLAAAILACAHQYRPTLFFSVPTHFAAMLHETDTANPYDLRSVRLGISAAEPLPAEIVRRWRERFGFQVLDGIGSTEVLHIYISNQPGGVRPGSSGVPVPGYQVRITNEIGCELPAGETGDLWVRGASNSTEYWNRPQLTAERMRGGWFFSGDKYRVDAEGYYWYAGRSDDMFRVSGEWVSPIEVESALIEHPAVLEAAVVARRGESGLPVTCAFVTLKEPACAGEALADELRATVHERLAGYKCPRRIEFLEALPKTATGKIQRYKLR